MVRRKPTMPNASLLRAPFLLGIACAVLTPATAQIYKGAKPEELNQGKGTLIPVLENRLTPDQLRAYLGQRTSGQMFGTFNAYSSLLYAVHSVAIWDQGTGIGQTPVESPFLKDYQPTWQELLDVLARQVNCTWRYNHDTGYWVFEKGMLPLPYTLKRAPGWRGRANGNNYDYVPRGAPMGMDVYMMGHYSSDDPGQLEALVPKIRKHLSMGFAPNFKPDVTDADFRTEQIAGVDALYFTAPAPNDPKLIWRQWSFVKDGWAFVIVSLIHADNEAKLLPDVQRMLASFEVVPASAP